MKKTNGNHNSIAKIKSSGLFQKPLFIFAFQFFSLLSRNKNIVKVVKLFFLINVLFKCIDYKGLYGTLGVLNFAHPGIIRIGISKEYSA